MNQAVEARQSQHQTRSHQEPDMNAVLCDGRRRHPPDVVRVQRPICRNCWRANWLKDLTPYFQGIRCSSRMTWRQPTITTRRSPHQFGDGPIYGMVKDCRPTLPSLSTRRPLKRPRCPSPTRPSRSRMTSCRAGQKAHQKRRVTRCFGGDSTPDSCLD